MQMQLQETPQVSCRHKIANISLILILITYMLFSDANFHTNVIAPKNN